MGNEAQIPGAGVQGGHLASLSWCRGAGGERARMKGVRVGSWEGGSMKKNRQQIIENNPKLNPIMRDVGK